MCGKSSVKHEVAGGFGGGKDRKIDGKRGVGSASQRTVTVTSGHPRTAWPEPPIESPRGLADRARFPRKTGEIAHNLPQRFSNDRVADVKVNLTMLIEHAPRLTTQELQDVIQEVVPSDVLNVFVLDHICKELADPETGLTHEQIHALGRGLCWGLDQSVLESMLAISWSRCERDTKYRDTAAKIARWQTLMGGALSTFVEREYMNADRLEQQIQFILALKTTDESLLDARPVLGALVSERRLDKINAHDYGLICHAASHCVKNGKFSHLRFKTFIPQPGSGRQDLHPAYSSNYAGASRRQDAAPFLTHGWSDKSRVPPKRREAAHPPSSARPESKSSTQALTTEQAIILKAMEDPAMRARIFQALADSTRSPSS